MAEEIEKLRAVLEQNPTDKSAFTRLCEIADAENNHDYLAELCTFRAQVLEGDPEATELYLKAGNIYISNINDIPRGVQVLLKGFETDRTHVAIGERLDEIYRDAEDWEASL